MAPHNMQSWEEISTRNPSSDNQREVLDWVKNKVSIFLYFQHFTGSFQQESHDSDRQPHKVFKNNKSCKHFGEFIQRTIIDRLRMAAITLIGRVGAVEPPHLVLPLTVEPVKPRLCHDARFLNFWMQDKAFKLSSSRDLPQYVSKDSYQTAVDDISGYDHILLTNGHTFFGFQWGRWYFTYNTLPFGWIISPYIYHITGLLATHFFRSIKIPYLLYIDDRHNGQIQVPLNEGEYATLSTDDERKFAAAKSAIFLISYDVNDVRLFSEVSKVRPYPKEDSALSRFCGRLYKAGFPLNI